MGIKEIGARIVQLLFPLRCVLCDEITDCPEEGICRECRAKLIYIRPPFCSKCGRQLQEEEEYCEECRRRTLPYRQAAALYDYGSAADSIFRFKYQNRQEYAGFYGRELFERKGKWLLALKPDALIPVPIHAARKRRRGYNQAELIAAALSRLSGIPMDAGLIGRTKRTLPQKNLRPSQRQNNLKKAFKILRNDVKLNTIVIIDDIYTTGSTVSAMTEVLLEAGIRNVYVLALAMGRG